MKSSNLYHALVILLSLGISNLAQASTMPQAICAGLLEVAQANPNGVITDRNGQLGGRIAEHLKSVNTRGSAEVFAHLLWPEEGQKTWVVLFEFQPSGDAHKALGDLMEAINRSEAEIHRSLGSQRAWTRWLHAFESFRRQDRKFLNSVETVFLASRDAMRTGEPMAPFALTGKTEAYRDLFFASDSNEAGRISLDFQASAQTVAEAKASVSNGLRSVAWALGFDPSQGPESSNLSVTLIMNPREGRGALAVIQTPRQN